MITDQDIEKMKGTFATSEALESLRTHMTYRFAAVEDRLEVMDEKMDHVITVLDSLAGKYQDSLDEHRAGAQILARHDRQIRTLATATGTSLPD